jgi:hypothetical protein
MNIIDFLIGLTLVNTLPHFVLGIWKGRMMSLFGFSPTANIIYGLFNLAISLALYLWQYGWQHLIENEMMLGGLFVIVGYFVLGKICYRAFHVKHLEGK